MLTDEEIATIAGEDLSYLYSGDFKFARAVEAEVLSRAVPPGHVVVPVEPTEAMLIQGAIAASRVEGYPMQAAKARYAAMLEAAQKEQQT